jgi:Zn-dependent protease with chaperone function
MLQSIDPSQASTFVLAWLALAPLAALLAEIGSDEGSFFALATRQPMAFTLGWFEPKIFISRGMQAACSTQEIDCMLYHEAAHRQRRDNLRLLTSRLLTAPLPLRWAMPAQEDLKLSCEQACDLQAAAILSPEAVAAALITITRVQQQSAPIGSLAFAGNRTRQRILALLEEPQGRMANETVFAISSVILLSVLAMINPLHRAIELIP